MARHNVVRKIKNRTTIILVMLLISIMVSWVIWGNLSVETTKLTVTSKDLPEAFDKFSIAHISDLHKMCIRDSSRTGAGPGPPCPGAGGAG